MLAWAKGNVVVIMVEEVPKYCPISETQYASESFSPKPGA